MRKLLVKDLHPGMITAEDIFSIDGQLILPKKIILTQNGIEKLEAFAIYSVRIEDEEVAPPQTSFFDTPSYSERIKSNPDFINFKKSFEDHVESLQTGLNQIVESNSGFDAENLLSQTLVLIGEGQASSINMMDMLLNMRDYDDSTYAHVSKTKKLHRRRPVFLTRRPIVNVSNQIPILSILKKVLKIMWNPCRQD